MEFAILRKKNFKNYYSLKREERTVYCNRDVKIDLVKGMGILLMVFRHTEAPFSEFVLLFHMAIFFIASGYLFDESKINNVKSLVRYYFKKIRGLWLPYFGFMSLFVLLHNIFLELNIITDNIDFLTKYTGRYALLEEKYAVSDTLREIFKAFLFLGNEQAGGTLVLKYFVFINGRIFNNWIYT